jgi:hypothetical protein
MGCVWDLLPASVRVAWDIPMKAASGMHVRAADYVRSKLAPDLSFYSAVPDAGFFLGVSRFNRWFAVLTPLPSESTTSKSLPQP